MTSTQVSFSAFARSQRDLHDMLVARQKSAPALECTPPASTPVVPALVAQDGSGGECTPLRARRMRLLVDRRWLQPPRFVTVAHSLWGPLVYRWTSRAYAWNQAQAHGYTFFDLGAAA